MSYDLSAYSDEQLKSRLAVGSKNVDLLSLIEQELRARGVL